MNKNIDLVIFKLSNLSMLGGILFITFFSIYQESFLLPIEFILVYLIGSMLAGIKGGVAKDIYATIYGISVISCIALYLIYINRYGAPYIGGGSDDFEYESAARILADNAFIFYNPIELGELINNPSHNSKGYVYLINLIIQLSELIGSYNSLMPRVLNCGILGLSAVLVYSISEIIGIPKRFCKVAALWTGLFPLMIFCSIHVFRDILITLLILLSCSNVLDAIASNDYKKILLNIPIIILVCTLRFVYILPIINISIIGFILIYLNKNRLEFLKFTVIFITILFFFGVFGDQVIYFATEITEQISLYSAMMSDGAKWSSEDGISNALFSSPAPWVYILRFLYALISPIPNISENIEIIFISIGTGLQIIFLPFVFLGIIKTFKERKMLPILVIFITLFFGFTFGSFTIRHIISFVPFGIIYGVIGYLKYRGYSQIILISSSSILFVLGITYLIIK